MARGTTRQYCGPLSSMGIGAPTLHRVENPHITCSSPHPSRVPSIHIQGSNDHAVKWLRYCLEVKVLDAQLCLTLCDPMDCSPPGSSIHGILQARILEWVAISSSRRSSQSRDRAWVFRITGRFFSIWATREGWSYRLSGGYLIKLQVVHLSFQMSVSSAAHTVSSAWGDVCVYLGGCLCICRKGWFPHLQVCSSGWFGLGERFTHKTNPDLGFGQRPPWECWFCF